MMQPAVLLPKDEHRRNHRPAPTPPTSLQPHPDLTPTRLRRDSDTPDDAPRELKQQTPVDIPNRVEARPLEPGEPPTFADIRSIEGDTYKVGPGTNITVDGENALTVPANYLNGGYFMPVFVVILDQGGNIINSSRISIIEDSQPANEAAKQAKMKTSNGEEIVSTSNGIFVDLWGRVPGSELRSNLQTSQSFKVVRGLSTLFTMNGISGTYDDKSRTIIRREGQWKKNF